MSENNVYFPFGQAQTQAEHFSLLKITARQAMDAGKWVLCATICRLIAEYEHEEAQRAGDRVGWDSATRRVPLLKMPMRDEQPSEPLPEVHRCKSPVKHGFTGHGDVDLTAVIDSTRPQYDRACGTCGGHIRYFEIEKAWIHIDHLGRAAILDHDALYVPGTPTPQAIPLAEPCGASLSARCFNGDEGCAVHRSGPTTP